LIVQYKCVVEKRNSFQLSLSLYYKFTAKSVSEKKLWKSVSIWQS